jgi:hypothetical protein
MPIAVRNLRKENGAPLRFRCQTKGRPESALSLFARTGRVVAPTADRGPGGALLQRTRVEGTLPPGLGSATPRVVKRSASHAIKSGPSRRGVPARAERPIKNKAARSGRLEVGCPTGRPGSVRVTLDRRRSSTGSPGGSRGLFGPERCGKS